MTLSLIICTHNRADQLASCLQSVSDMDHPEGFELIVVDNASTDSTSEVVKRFAATQNFPVHLVYEPVAGLGRARNRGWRASRGEIIAFTDDDCYVDKGFGKAVLSTFSSDKGLGFVGGRIMLFDNNDLRVTIKESLTRENYLPGQIIPAGAIQGANFSFRRSALENAGGFDPLLGPGTTFTADDVEMLARVSIAGWKGVYTPDPVVYHHHGRKTPSDLAKLMKSYDYGRGAYYMSMIINPGQRLQAIRFWIWWLRRGKQKRKGQKIIEIMGGLGYLWQSTFKYFYRREKQP